MNHKMPIIGIWSMSTSDLVLVSTSKSGERSIPPRKDPRAKAIVAVGGAPLSANHTPPTVATITLSPACTLPFAMGYPSIPTQLE